MKTKKNKFATNKTRKIYSIKPSLRVLKKGFPLYASKKYEGSTILEYNKNEELKYHDKCLKQNSSWFGDLIVAKSYKTKDTHIYRWKTKKVIKLLNTNSVNDYFIDNIFKNSKTKLIPTINFTKDEINKIKYDHSYLNMSTNERALYEFKFCFGFKRRDGGSILNKIKIKINYYKVSSFLGKKEKNNRLSFYDFDKHAIMNLCKIVNNKKYNISGVYQKNNKSFWFPNFIVYKMDIQEYILFDPQDNLVYDKLIE